MENRYNLVDEAWIPIDLHGDVSLRQVFEDGSLKALGGTAIQKLAILKLLLAIAQRADTPRDDEEWLAVGEKGLGRRCVEYLEGHRDLFYLYGERPFLQFPALRDKDLASKAIGFNYLPDLPAENNTILNESQIERPLSDAEKAVFIVSLMNYSFGGKRVDRNSPVFSPGYDAKKLSAKPGPSLGNLGKYSQDQGGYLQTCFQGDSVLNTVWLNLLTEENLNAFAQYRGKPIIPPWEAMPEGEDDANARQIKEGFMGTLCGMSRFVYLKEDGIVYTNGLEYPSHKEGWREPFLSFTPETDDKKTKIIWTDPGKRPWRNLAALLELCIGTSASSDYVCPQIRLLFRRNRRAQKRIGVFSGGLKVSTNSGDQSVKQTDDFVSDTVFLDSQVVNEEWFLRLKEEMTQLDRLSGNVYKSIESYWQDMKGGRSSGKPDSFASGMAAKGQQMFWELCDGFKQELFDKSKEGAELVAQRKRFACLASRAFDSFCPKGTPAQIGWWAVHRPSFKKYLSLKKEDGNGKG